MRELAASSYTVYAIYVFPVLFLQVALLGPPMPALAKFGLVSILAVPLCFELGYGMWKLPGVAHAV